ncbi:MAG: pyroglutamyl-peptidase I [Clostridia bacterium]|nr:pyroglutamyl-peptidase I [Clostridia bacterium]
MSILLTGFEPFDGAGVNPSWEAVCRVPDRIAGHEVHRLLLPVVYGEAAGLLREAIERLRPEIVICCGVAGDRKAVTPELAAINYRCARIPDNAGRVCRGEPIDPDGPAAFMTRLPIHAMIDAVQTAEIPCALSLSAGAYVCNDVYFALLSAEEEYGHRGLFVHVPGAGTVSSEEAARAIALCAETAVNS